MPATAGYIWNEISDAIRMKDDDTMRIIKYTMQNAYYELCAMLDWDLLRRKVTKTFTVSDTTGLYMPADMAGITRAFNQEDPPTMYWPVQESDKEQEDNRHRWFYFDSETTPLFDQTGLVINQNATSFSATPTLSGNLSGEYAQFDQEPGLYKITGGSGSYTITPPYRGPGLTGSSKHLYVRPPTQKRIGIVDHVGEIAADEITFHYWVYPEPLYASWQTIMLPNPLPLQLLTIVKILGLQEGREKQADNYRNAYKDAIEQMRIQNKHMPRINRPRTKTQIGQDGKGTAYSIHHEDL